MTNQARVHLNTHLNKFSVCLFKNGRYILDHHTDELVMINCELIVYQAGRLRVLKEKQKNVHAFVFGTVVDNCTTHEFDSLQPISYNPYKYNTFVTLHDLKPVQSCNLMVLTSNPHTTLLGCPMD